MLNTILNWFYVCFKDDKPLKVVPIQLSIQTLGALAKNSAV